MEQFNNGLALLVLEDLCSSAQVPPEESITPCPANQRNCVCCLLENIIRFRLIIAEKKATAIKEELCSSPVFRSIDLDKVETRFAAYILLAVQHLAHNFSAMHESEVASYKRLLGMSFDAIFFVFIFPLVPDGVLTPLDKKLCHDSVLRLSSTHTHHSYDERANMLLLDKMMELFVVCMESPALFEEFLVYQNGMHVQDLLGCMTYLAESPIAKIVLENERCLFWLKKLEIVVIPKLPNVMAMRIFLESINRYSQVKLSYGVTLYSKLLSKSIVGCFGVKNFFQVFLESGLDMDVDKLPSDELWKRSLAVAQILIKCPAFVKPSEYYPNITCQLLTLLDSCLLLSKEKASLTNFPASVFGAYLLQPQLMDSKNAYLSQKLAIRLRMHAYPVMLGPFIRLSMDWDVFFNLNDQCLADLRFLWRLSAAIGSIPESVWFNVGTGDLQTLLRALASFLMEIFAAFDGRVSEVAHHCKVLLLRFFAFFPLVPESISSDIVTHWLMRSVLPQNLCFNCSPICPSEQSPFSYKLVEEDANSFNVESRLASVKIVLGSFSRRDYVCAIWSLLLSCLNRLLLIIGANSNETSQLCHIYTVLASLSEEVSEFPELELSDLMMTSNRFISFLHFFGVICDRFLIMIETEDAEDKTELSGVLESTISLSLTILSSTLVEKSDDPIILQALKSIESKLENLLNSKMLSEQCKCMLKAFLTVSNPENFLLNDEVSESSASIIADESINKALLDIANPMCAIKGHGLISIRRILENSKTLIQENAVMDLLQIFLQCISHEDSYVHLNAVSTITAMASRYHKFIMPRLSLIFSGQDDTCGKVADIDTRIRVGECLCRIIRALGDIAPVYRELLFQACFQAAKSKFESKETEEETIEDMQIKMRSSALSTLGQLAGALKFSLSSDASEVLLCVASFLSSISEHVEVRRAAACSLVLLLRGFSEDRTLIFQMADVLRDVGRILRRNKFSCLDEVLQLHIDLGLQEIDRLGRIILEPENRPKNLIQIIDN